MTELDEKLMHFRNIRNIMQKHRRIAIYALPGEGKSTVIEELKKKFEPEWHFYPFGGGLHKEPYVIELPDTFLPDRILNEMPAIDIIYCLQYSREYKERITGISFGDVYRPFMDYIKEMKYARAGQLNLSGRRFKSIEELENVIRSVM
jgi:hypothetical protein